MIAARPNGIMAVERNFATAARPRVVRGHQEFAESEIWVTNGPHPDDYFRCENQPISRLLFDELDRGWPRVVATGPSQSGKTLNMFVIPLLRAVYELREDVIVGVPEADMAAAKWEKDIEPSLIQSPNLQHLIPKKGAGSKGGSVKDSIKLGNGVSIKIMTRGSSDAGKAGFTSRYVFATEAAAWSTSTGNSAESSPFEQLEARQRSHRRSERRMMLEGTLTDRWSLPWTLKAGDEPDGPPISTDSRIMCKCPHCPKWVMPEREHLSGWQGAANERAAEDLAAFCCPKCGAMFTEAERILMNRQALLVHHGQKISRGKVVGDLPPVSTLFFRYNGFNNLFTPQSDLGVDEWLASQRDPDSEEGDSAEKKLSQFVHALPYEPKSFTGANLTRPQVRTRVSLLRENELPADTKFLTMGIDPGKSAKTAWFQSIAARSNKTFAVPTYSNFDLDVSGSVEIGLRDALDRIRDQVVEPGLMQGDGTRKEYDRVGVDIGWQTETVSDFIRDSNEAAGRELFIGTRGRGKSVLDARNYSHPKRKGGMIKLVSEARYYIEENFRRRLREVTYDADHWKLQYQRHFAAKLVTDEETGEVIGPPGAITLFSSLNPKRHDTIAKHITSERQKSVRKAGKGITTIWDVTGANHELDAGSIAIVMAHIEGFRITKDNVEKQPAKSSWGKSRGRRRRPVRRRGRW
jgi:phage terminase large subunit GpA-like protein